MTDMNDLFADAPVLAPATRYAAAFAVEATDFDTVHRLMGEEDDEDLEAREAYALATM